ncbi:DUF3289 family protein [Aeromonas veronii]|uniref:DUF3289 family protein n=1 Tax=Aeromonas veronii TaxID=654 RepID=UPI0035B9A352
MATKSIGELTQDEFLRILGPDQGSSRDGSRVAVGRSTRDSCVNVVDGKLQVNGSDEFRRTVEAAYEAKKTPSSGFGSAPYRPEPIPEPEPTLSKLMPKTDTTSATKVNVPILVYQSPRKPGLNADGTKAADMVSGDMSAEDIRRITTHFGTQMFDLDKLEQVTSRNLFSNFRVMGAGVFSAGDMRMVILAMIAKFESKEGGEFRHPVLTQKVKEHKDTQNFINSVTKQVQRYIKDKDGNIDGEPLANWMSSYKEKIKIPVFNSRRNVIDSPSSPFPDAFGGLAMAINDVWGARAEIIKFQRYGNYYKGTLRFTLYDHFGLDSPDVGEDPTTGKTKPYGLLAGFRSWFILQHYNRFAYKPFITVMEINKDFEGQL